MNKKSGLEVANNMKTIIRDVTEQKQAQIDLQNSEARNRAFLAAIPDLISLIDDRGIHLESISENPSIDVVPHDSKKVGRPLSDLLPLDLAARKLCAVRDALATGQVQVYEQQIWNGDRLQYEEVRVAPAGDRTAIAMMRDITDRKQAEEALRVSEERLREIAETISQFFFIRTAATGEFIYISPAYERIWGRPCESLRENPQIWLEAIHPDDLDYVLHSYAHQSESQITRREYRIIRPDGAIRWISAEINIVRDLAGTPLRYVGFAEDITERKQAELDLQEREARLRSLGDNLPQGFIYQFVRDPDGQYRFSYISAGVEQITGVSSQVILNDARALHSLMLDEDRQLRDQLVEESWRNNTVFEMQLRRQTTWGEIRWSSVRSIPRTLENGCTVWDGVDVDITELKQAEAALRESEERFRRVFEDASVGMAIASVDGRLIRVNQALCNIVGHPPQDLLAMTFQDITYAEDLETESHYAQQLLNGDIHHFRIEKRYVHRQGHLTWVLLNVSLVKDDRGQPQYVIALAQDINDRKAIDRLKDEFISIVSHELRTPLTSIQGSLGLLATGIYDNQPAKMKRMIEIALTDSNRLVRMVNEILDVERLRSGQVLFDRKRCNVTDLLQEAAEAVRAIAHDAAITLSIQPFDRLIQAAPDAIIQVLINLLSNAIKFSTPGSTVWMSAEWIDSQDALAYIPSSLHPPHYPTVFPSLLFSIQDQGRGIPPDQLERIFERFHQVDVSDSRQKGGTGLGLAICRSTVHQQGGQIWAESTVGQGSTFYFTIPVEDHNA
jgi:PAS domain S-box-containing protein